MGLHFGQLAKLRGIIYYRLSSHEQKAFAGFFKNGIPNTYRRFKDNIFRIGPPCMFGYLLFDWAEKENYRVSCKDPKDFENDQ